MKGQIPQNMKECSSNGHCLYLSSWDFRYQLPMMLSDPLVTVLGNLSICIPILIWTIMGLVGLNPLLELPISDFVSASILFNCICIKGMIESCSPAFNPWSYNYKITHLKRVEWA
jgi:hypothetical protein